MGEKIRYNLNKLSESTITPTRFDLLIVSVDSDEERSKQLLAKIIKKGVKIEKIAVVAFGFSTKEVRTLFCELGYSIQSSITIIEACKNNYYENANTLWNMIDSEISNDSIVGIDITGMTTPLFFLVTKWLSTILDKLFVYYTQPERYIMNEGLFKSYFSAVGPVSVLEIDGFPGESANDEAGDRLLICMLGFDNDLLPEVIQEAGPQKIIAVNGFPSFFPKFKDISLSNNQKILTESDYVKRLEKTKSLASYYYVEADNPFEAYNTLDNIVDEYGKYCIDIVPLGTKPMALGVCLYAIKHDNIRVVFPFPEIYASGTSLSNKDIFEYELFFT